jgi:hypothetical protein
MRRLATTLAAAALLAGIAAAPAAAEFGLSEFDVSFEKKDGSTLTQAGAHPFAMRTTFGVNGSETPEGGVLLDEQVKDLLVKQVRGLAGDPTAVPRCTTAEFLTSGGTLGSFQVPACPDSSAVGYIGTQLASKLTPPGNFLWFAVYNLKPPPGVAASLGFWVSGVPVPIDVGVGEEHPNELVGASKRLSQVVEVLGVKLVLWGVPGDPAHDALRGHCIDPATAESLGDCEANIGQKPFLTTPRACEGPLTTSWEAVSWQQPAKWISGSALTHDELGEPRGFSGCGKLEFAPGVSSQATTTSAESPSGLDFTMTVSDEGLANPEGLAASDLKKAVVTLPEGMTANPSVGEGLGVCTPAQLDAETIETPLGQGCPNASKIGTVHLETPIIDQAVDGSVYLAQQDDPSTSAPGAENPFDSLIAFYIVLRNEDLGVLVKLPAKVEPDPVTGQLTTTVEDIPQYPFSRFEFHFREGQRAPLVTPARCGTYTTKAVLTPWANPNNPLSATSTFQITRGSAGGPCPSGGIPPFHPQFEAGALNNNAGSFSPFDMRLQRADGEQDMTKFSSILPRGEIGSLVGVGKCSEAAIAVAKSKSGRQELASPSCPANSRIGRTLAGAGVGESLTYVGGTLYLAGPYKGAPLSVVSITPAVAGPFDAGTVVVRLGLDVNPRTAEVEVDGAASDPIPHILKGIVLKLRDLRVYVDRPNFTLNPTSCDESSARATLFGSYLDVFSPADDVPVSLSSRYQAANCLNLDFKPKLDPQLKGGTKRGGHPGLIATFTPRAGDANTERLVVRLPRSAFLDQAHIRTICTRVQFAAKACPAAAQYGQIKATTPLLEDPLEGPVYLRSSDHKLPDLVFDLHGLIDIEVSARIDSVRGGIRSTLTDLPDAPLTQVVLRMQGGQKGLIVNSRNLCAKASKVEVDLTGQNGKTHSAKPELRALGCKGKRKRG